MKIQDLIRGHSIDNLRSGKIIAKDDQKHTVRVGTTELTFYYAGAASVGDIVILECPDGDLNKGYILEASPLIMGEGTTCEI